MARPTNKMRLRDVDPIQVSEDCVRALVEEATRIVRVLRPAFRLEESDVDADT